MAGLFEHTNDKLSPPTIRFPQSSADYIVSDPSDDLERKWLDILGSLKLGEQGLGPSFVPLNPRDGFYVIEWRYELYYVRKELIEPIKPPI